jgi:hypothetical protein
MNPNTTLMISASVLATQSIDRGGERLIINS